MEEAKLLQCFKLACIEHLENPDLYTHLSTIKQAFFERKYLDIFTNQQLIPIYATAYGPSRALCYRELFSQNILLSNVLERDAFVYCLGAGSGSELMALGSSALKATIHIQDLSKNLLLHKMHASLKKIYGNEIKVEYSIADILDSSNTLVDELIAKADLITACFLLNELLSTSKKGFAQLVMRLVKVMKTGLLFANALKLGSMLLVVDSAGSFSDVNVANKQYMCYRLLDGIRALESVASDDSVWYRFPKGLIYHGSLKLNNTRYFYRLYRKVSDD